MRLLVLPLLLCLSGCFAYVTEADRTLAWQAKSAIDKLQLTVADPVSKETLQISSANLSQLMLDCLDFPKDRSPYSKEVSLKAQAESKAAHDYVARVADVVDPWKDSLPPLLGSALTLLLGAGAYAYRIYRENKEKGAIIDGVEQVKQLADSRAAEGKPLISPEINDILRAKAEESGVRASLKAQVRARKKTKV